MTMQQTIGRIEPASRTDWVLPADVAGAPGAERLQGKRIGVVGGGLAGLTTAFVLAGMGVHADLYEAAERFGGRVLTLRHGDPLPDDPTRRVTLPDGQLVEAGATRVHPHMVTMEYLRLLDIPIAPLVTRNDDALLQVGQGTGSQVLRQRDWWQEVLRAAVRPDVADAFPHLVADGAADQAPHRTRRALGALSDVGDPTAPPAVGREPWEARLLVDGAPARSLLADLSALKSTTLFRIVGGSDVLVSRLAERLPAAQRHLCHRLSSVVTTRDGIRLGFATPEGARHETYDHVILALPPHQLAYVVEDFPTDLRTALEVPEPRPAVKAFVAYAQRWWEHELGIYGGTSYPDSPVDRLWYPSAAWHGPGGILTAYCLKDNARALDAVDEETRHRMVVDRIAALHPGVSAATEPVAVHSVSWSRVPHVHGAWVNWPGYEHPAFRRLQQGLGRIQFAGDWLSPLTAWMAGAFSSAGEALLRTIENASERK
ncbi:flavin monoamine oxidase family protein [Streptomyces sp. NPDC048254]|uniref:flavin monoamine oxidase family protein n=1 Tax=Streptomyces sp. NPDC048254 TaxID=3365525 RepID=UPI00371478D9